MGDFVDRLYREAHGSTRLDAGQVADAVVDFKRRIDGDFRVTEQSDTRIVLENRRCPFGASVDGRPALCMMTSNVFGRLASRNLGYAKVDIEEAIALGHPGCKVIVHLNRKDAENSDGIEYFGADGDER